MSNFTKQNQNHQPKKYKKKNLLTHLQCFTTTPLSYKEQAEIVGCSEIFAKKVTASNVKEKIIKKELSYYSNRRSGKNRFSRGENFDPCKHFVNNKYLIVNVMFQKITCRKTGKLKTVKKIVRKFVDVGSPEHIEHMKKMAAKSPSNQKSIPHKRIYKENSNKLEFAKGKRSEFSNKNSPKQGFLKHKLEVLDAYGFKDLAKNVPAWWFRDLERLKSALKLTRKKLKKGFKCKNLYKFVSFLLKHGVFGYRRHAARNLSVAIARPSLERVEPYLRTDPIRQTYEGLTNLWKKYGLKIDFDSMQMLLRRRFPHLTAAVDVCQKRLKFESADPIRNVTGFLSFLLGMDEPYDYLRKKQRTQYG